ncbi:ABC transporter permease [Aeropyrum camini]|uniref:ABC transporter permease n=1 Tax=Aeropyrum camini TaxID=229980 RepID=UPI00078725E4|nr:ABC transporter permease [Aeropyrum camini]
MAQLSRAFLWLVRKELLLAARNPVLLATQALFTLAMAVAAGALEHSSLLEPGFSLPPMLAALALFQAVFTAYTSYIREAEWGTLEALRTSPVDPGLVYLAKTLYSAASIFLTTLAFLPVYAVLASPPIPLWGYLMLGGGYSSPPSCWGALPASLRLCSPTAGTRPS